MEEARAMICAYDYHSFDRTCLTDWLVCRSLLCLGLVSPSMGDDGNGTANHWKGKKKVR